MRLCMLPRTNLLFFASSRVRQYPTVTATSRRGSRARFDGDIGQVIIDVSLVLLRHSLRVLTYLALHHRVATRGRGCRCQHIDIQQNKLMRGRNALASTDPPQQTNYPSNCAWPSTNRWPPSQASALLKMMLYKNMELLSYYSQSTLLLSSSSSSFLSST